MIKALALIWLLALLVAYGTPENVGVYAAKAHKAYLAEMLQ